MLQASVAPAAAGRAGQAPTAAQPAPAESAGVARRVVQQAARDLFPGREVAVESFYDKASGRFVHRIADGESGEILAQTPSDSLLRFFASGRQPLGEPLLRLEA
ncbi:MAG: hypothetical protein R3C69_07800 [Geminicoccaceae bacterium]